MPRKKVYLFTPRQRDNPSTAPMDRVKEIATLLDISIEEAKQVMADDKAIDKGEKLFELTENQKKAEKQMRSMGIRKRPVIPPSGPPPRKPNQEKRELIEILATALGECGQALNISNPERQIDFEYKGAKYRVVLSAPRK